MYKHTHLCERVCVCLHICLKCQLDIDEDINSGTSFSLTDYNY